MSDEKEGTVSKVVIPGYKSLTEFIQMHNISYSQALKDLRKGYCSWPGRRNCPSKSHDLFYTWHSMLRRAYFKKKDKNYKYYGNIDVCANWVVSFYKFAGDMGPRPTPQHSIDRIDNKRGYHPDNCRWATKRQQAQNTSSFKGYIVKVRNSFRVSFMVDKVTTNRYFKTEAEAKQWVLESGLLDNKDV